MHYETFAIDQSPWPTMDPFLFIAHHLDHYPAGDGSLGPDAVLDGRQLGQDFGGIDGWNMYHGSKVPGFPQHPHRGFETVTVVRSGYCDHSDSLGATARFGQGDAQWLTAGRGISHSEMFPLIRTNAPNPLDMFQIWLNLPMENKMADPHFSMFWSDDIPRVTLTDKRGRTAQITLVAGSLEGHTAPAPPPDSWAAGAKSDVAIWHIKAEPSAIFTLPPAKGEKTNRVLYVYDGSGVEIAGQRVAAGHGVVVEAARDAPLVASEGGAQVLMLQGAPIEEPVAKYGPFVMNDKDGLRKAFIDYQQGLFGRWPWEQDDPAHPAAMGRFARHPDGRVDFPAGTPEPFDVPTPTY